MCSVFILLSLQLNFLEIILKGNEGIGNHIQVFYAISPAASCWIALCPVEGGNDLRKGTILIVTSYNPETRSISDNLSAFMDEYRQRGGKYTPITIESMNCKNLSEALPVESAYGLHPWKV